MKFSLSVILALLLLPTLVFAASDDAILNSGTELSVNGITLTVAASAVSSITVNADNFTVDMLGDSGITVTAASRNTFTVSPTSRIDSFTCSSSQSVLKLSGNPNAETAETVTVTPSSTACGAGGGSGTVGGSGSSVSSGGSGGGGGSSSSVAAVTAATPATPATPSSVSSSGELGQLVELFIALGIIPADKAVQARSVVVKETASGVTVKFSRGLGLGSRGDDVKRLQEILNSDPDTQITVTGPGSKGNETDYLGSATQKALQKFQVKHGIAGPGDPGYGFVGPKTREKLEGITVGVPAAEVAKPSPVAQTVSPVFNRSLTLGARGEDVKRLQQLLNSDPDTRVAASGVGSAGNETDYFGPGTGAALQKFQVKYGISGPGEPGYGSVGPKTRAKLKEVFGN
ncbi:MAG: peptidoglycan-binding protein [Parcubacteria group bacterium]|nr:peptidoglycan-binding protein [Parcubacteria group bacterium]